MNELEEIEMEKELIALKNKIDQAKIDRSVAEDRLENLKKEENEILEELNRLNIKPQELKSKIESLEKEISSLLQEAEKLIHED